MMRAALFLATPKSEMVAAAQSPAKFSNCIKERIVSRRLSFPCAGKDFAIPHHLRIVTASAMPRPTVERLIWRIAVFADESVPMLLVHIFTDPGKNKVRNLQIVPVLHQHVAIAVESYRRQLHQFGISTRCFQLIDEGLAAGKGSRPESLTGNQGARQVISKDHKGGNLASVWICAGVAEHWPSMVIMPLIPELSVRAACSGKKPDLGVTHDDGPTR